MKLRIVPLFIVFLFGVFSLPVMAQEYSTVRSDKENRELGGEKPQNKLSEVRLRACQAREESIKKRTSSLVNLVVKMESKFDAIALRVEEFYTTKVLSSGKSVSNYDSLVNDIQTKKNAVSAAVSEIENSSSNFSCNGDDPKGLLNQFRMDMQSIKKLLQEYRTAIKNLIVAVQKVTPVSSASPEVRMEGESQ